MVNQQLEAPLIVKDVTLMSPGTWNEWKYTPEELKKAFASRDYNSEEINLFLDHPEDPHNAAGDWVGRVKNLRQLADSTIKGDLEIYDQETIYKLSVAKAKFGVSPRLLGEEDEQNMTFRDIIFDNWSIVSKPAQNTAMINLSSRLGFDGLSIMSLSKKEIDSEELKHKKYDFPIETKDKKKKDEDEDNVPKRKKSTKMKGGKKDMSEKEKEEKQLEEESQEDSEDSQESEDSEESDSGEDSQDLSDAQVLDIISNDLEGFSAFKKQADPSLSMKELAVKFKERNDKLNFIENLSETEATVALKKILGKIGVNELGQNKQENEPVKVVNSETKELSKKLEGIEKQIKELNKKDKVPSPKSVKNLSTPSDTSFSMTGNGGYSNGVKELAQEIFKKRGW